MRGLRAAATLLTRVKVGGSVSWPADVAKGAPWFSVVGGAVGCVVAGAYGVAGAVVPAPVAAAVAVAIGVWVTGAFHEDGLADTADALGHRRAREETLRILKDPRLGTYGVTAIVLTMVLRVTALSSLDGGQALAIVTAAHALSRAGTLVLLLGPVVEGDGLAGSSAAVVGGRHVVPAIATASAIGLVTLGSVLVPAAAGVAIVCLLVGRAAWRRIGGVTGDLLGAAQQLGELAVLLIGVAVAEHGWLNVPWW